MRLARWRQKEEVYFNQETESQDHNSDRNRRTRECCTTTRINRDKDSGGACVWQLVENYSSWVSPTHTRTHTGDGVTTWWYSFKMRCISATSSLPIVLIMCFLSNDRRKRAPLRPGESVSDGAYRVKESCCFQSPTMRYHSIQVMPLIAYQLNNQLEQELKLRENSATIYHAHEWMT